MVSERAQICTVCGGRKTTHPSGVCSRCRKSKGSRPCIRCGQHHTAAKDGICSICRTSLGRNQRCLLTEDQAIERTELLLTVLKSHRNGRSYSQIAEMLGLPRSTAYWMAMRARDIQPTGLELADPDAELEDR